MSSDVNGAQLVDEHGEPVGTVRDVIYDPVSAAPAWMIVKLGLLRGAHYVPVAGSYRSVEDDVVVPYAASQIQAAPKAKNGHVISPELEDELERHYRTTAA